MSVGERGLAIMWKAGCLMLACALSFALTGQTSLAKSNEKPVEKTEAAEKAKQLAAIQEQLQASFKQLRFDEIRDSDVPGIVEIYAGQQIIYFAPAQKILIFGQMYSAGGASITDEKQRQYLERKSGSIDRTSSIQIGKGPVDVVMFVDADCGYCRKAHAWFREKNFSNITMNVIFTNTEGRPDAHARALRAACAKETERAEALTQVFEGRNAVLPSLQTSCEGGEEKLAAQAKVASNVGVYATPMFLVKGQVVSGFDHKRLESLINGKD